MTIKLIDVTGASHQLALELGWDLNDLKGAMARKEMILTQQGRYLNPINIVSFG